MYKDFKQNESLDTGFVGGSGLIWMFSGIVLGLLVGLGMYYFTNDNSSALSMVGTVENKIKKVQLTSTNKQRAVGLESKQPVSEKEIRKTKFSYYAVLPTLDVPVGSVKLINTKQEKLPTKDSQNKTAKTETNVTKVASRKEKKSAKGNFLLQVASYKKKSRANITRGRLSKKGIDAYIQEKKIKGRLWYRVVAGPLDQSSINNWKSSAEKMGHHPMVISLR